jgi:hypothetical protein
MEEKQIWLRKAALEEVDNLKAIRAISWEQHSHSFKWLMASLLVLNGGASLAILSAENLPIDHRLWAGCAFVIGIVFALLVAVMGQRAIQSSFEPIQRYIGYWFTVAEDGERDEQAEANLAKELQGIKWKAKTSQGAGWLSAISFVVGVVVAGSGLERSVRNEAPVGDQSTIEAAR